MLDWSPTSNRLMAILNDMPQGEFEAVIRALLAKMRFGVTRAESSQRRLEFEATREGDERHFLVRVSRGVKAVTPEEVQTMVGRRGGERDLSPVFITTAGFTADAERYADMLGVALADGEKLQLLLERHEMADDLDRAANKRMLESEGDRFLPSIDELDSNMKWGNDFYSSGNYKKALEYYEAALNVKPHYELAWIMKGNSLTALGRFDDAVECFKKALEINPESEEAWYNLGATMYGMGRFEDELACYDKALEIRPDYAKAWNNKGATLHEMGKYNEAVLCYDKVLALEPDNHQVLNNRGVALMRLGEREGALRSFDTALRKKEDYLDAWLNRGVLLHEMGRNDEAAVCFDRVLSNWRTPEVLCLRGMALAGMGDFRLAVADFDASLQLKPGWQVAIDEREKALKAMEERPGPERKPAVSEQPRLGAAPELPRLCAHCESGLQEDARFCPSCGTRVDDLDEALMPVGKPAQLEAVEEDAALREAMDREGLLLERSRLLRAVGRSDDALRAIEEALGICERPEIWLEMGNVLAALGRHGDAVASYRRVLKGQPENFPALYNMADSSFKMGDAKAALEASDAMTGIWPGEARLWLGKAVILRGLGRRKDAFECLDRATQLDPELAEVWNAQGAALLELGKHDAAIICLDRALQTDPDFAEAWSNKGAVVLASGSPERSLQYFDRAVDIDPDNKGAWANKGAALYSMGRFAEAAECYEQALVSSADKHLVNSKGWALLGTDNLYAAIEAFDQAIALDQEFAEAWNNRGLAYSRKGDLAEAFDSFGRALAIDPDFEDARANRDSASARIRRSAGHPDTADRQPAGPAKPVARKGLEKAVRAAEGLQAEDLEADEFRCPYCGALGSIEDNFCDKCGQRLSRSAKEEAVGEKLEHILDGEPAERKPKAAAKRQEKLAEELITIPGIGDAKADLVIEAGYDSEAKLKRATVEDLARIPGISEGLARNIKKKYK
jgi:tetratricopeptide (TPR) repeat protein